MGYEKQSKSVDFPQGGQTARLVRGPDEVGTEDDGEVHGCHLVNLLVLCHLHTRQGVEEWSGKELYSSYPPIAHPPPPPRFIQAFLTRFTVQPWRKIGE